MNEKGSVVALVGADVSMASVDQKLQRALFSLIGSALATVFLLSLSVFLAAHKISQPVQQLKNAALNIAAGDYGTTVAVTEPLEIAELANTLNTMSACLKEHIERLRQNATTRERLLGEYECALLLQKRMFEGACEKFIHPHMRLYGLHSEVAAQPHGVYVTWKQGEHHVELSFTESLEVGFDSLYHLLQVHKPDTHQVQLQLHWPERRIRYACQGMLFPMLWSARQIIPLDLSEGEVTFQSGDIILVVSTAWQELFVHAEVMHRWLQRFLIHFGQEEADLFLNVARKEIAFLCDRSHLDKDLFLLCARL
jgi:HAMP domain-containing protein